MFFTIGIYFLLSPYLPLSVHQGFYTFSLLIKDLLLWTLPISIFFFIGSAIASFEKKAPLFILSLFLFEAISNGASVWYVYGWGHIATGYAEPVKIHLFNNSFSPLWRLGFTKPAWWSADKGTILAIILGLIAAFAFPWLKSFLEKGKQIAETVLTRFFAKLIPLFVLGFIARMVQTNLIHQVAGQYAELLLWLIVSVGTYILFLFFLGSGPGSPRFFQRIKNLLPATGIAFSSGCSLSTMPWTIEGTSKNLQNPDLAKAIIPATTNIQQIGDCIVNCFFCFIIYSQFNGFPPDLSTWISFSIVFVLARFATAAVIGGAIFIMLPVYESYLGFNPEMIATILALNVILDPLVTCANVIANGALCRVFEKVLMYFDKKKDARVSTD